MFHREFLAEVMCQHLAVGDVSCARIIVYFPQHDDCQQERCVGKRGSQRSRGSGPSIGSQSSFGLFRLVVVVVVVVVVVGVRVSDRRGRHNDDDGDQGRRQTTVVRWHSSRGLRRFGGSGHRVLLFCCVVVVVAVGVRVSDRR